MKNEYPVLIVRGGIYEDMMIEADNLLSGKSGDLIYMVLDSNGGDPNVGYRIMRLLQAKYKKIIAVVPAQAYSTATLMALGADIIYMRKSACLGPLDTQIKHPTDGSMISSLEIRDTLTTLAGSLITYAGDIYDTLTDSTGISLGKKQAADLSMKTAAELIRPITEKIDPIYLQKSTRSSKLAQKYAENLLGARMMKGLPRLARYVSIYLANSYDYHGYAIMLEEATETLALTADDVSALGHWDVIKERYDAHKRNGVYLESIKVTEPKPESDKSQKTKKQAATIKKAEGGKK